MTTNWATPTKRRKLLCNRAMGDLRRTDGADPIGASQTDGMTTGAIAPDPTDLPADVPAMGRNPATDGTVITRAMRANLTDRNAAFIPTSRIPGRATDTRRAIFAPDTDRTKSSACCTTCKRKSLS